MVEILAFIIGLKHIKKLQFKSNFQIILEEKT